MFFNFSCSFILLFSVSGSCMCPLSFPPSLCPQMAFSLLSYNRKQSRVESAFTVRGRHKHQINAPFKCVGTVCTCECVSSAPYVCFVFLCLSLSFPQCTGYKAITGPRWNLQTFFIFSAQIFFFKENVCISVNYEFKHTKMC